MMCPVIISFEAMDNGRVSLRTRFRKRKLACTMLDHCSISHRGNSVSVLVRAHYSRAPIGGVILWSKSFTQDASQLASSSSSPVNSLIREALIEGRTTEEKYEKDGYAVKWTFVNDLELIFVVCFFDSGRHYMTNSTGRVSTYPTTHLC